jgi:hypothetical protein
MTSSANIVGSRATKPYRPDAIVLATNQFANMAHQTWDFRGGEFVGIVISINTSGLWRQVLDAKWFFSLCAATLSDCIRAYPMHLNKRLIRKKR